MNGKWPRKQLGSVVEIASGQVDPRDAPYSAMRHIGGENIESETGRIVNVATAGELGLISGKYLFREDHLLYSKIRPGLNKVAMPSFAGICSADIYPLLPMPGVLAREYLAQVLRSRDFLAYAEKHSTRTNIPKINRDGLESYEIALPPLPEQRRIADILDRADALRAKRRVALAHLDELTQAIFVDMFGDPVSNPKGWPRKPFDEICPSRLGKMLDQKKQSGKHGRKYIRNANVRWFHVDVTDVYEMDFDSDDRDLFLLKKGDLLICEGGEPGRAAVWQDELPECYYQKAIHRGRPLTNMATAEYLAHMLWFLANGGGLMDHITSATIAHLTSEKLKAIKIPLPPLALQKVFSDRLAAIERVRCIHQEASSNLDNLFSSLQDRAFQGTL